MKNIMNLRWCAFTGALMLVFVAATFYHKEVTQEPQGVVTRWWDGTMQSRETFYPNGQMERRTVFGDDGMTVVSLEEWNRLGVPTHVKLRRKKDGRVEEVFFGADGKTIEHYKLWNGDEQTFVIERQFYPNGKIAMERLMTEDGLAATEQRSFEPDGQLRSERLVRDNADQETKMFSGGKLRNLNTFKANGDSLSESFDENGKVTMREILIRFDNSSVREVFDDAGKVIARRVHDGSPNSLIITTVFENDKVKLRQYIKNWDMLKVEEVSTETGLNTRVLMFDPMTSTVNRTETFRTDGTLERVKLLKDDGSVVKTIEYDSTGKTVTSEQEGGEPEKFDPKILLDASTGGR
jgi:antitoxin component YwqK of YwqJK toxin-antitoxin module